MEDIVDKKQNIRQTAVSIHQSIKLAKDNYEAASKQQEQGATDPHGTVQARRAYKETNLNIEERKNIKAAEKS